MQLETLPETTGPENHYPVSWETMQKLERMAVNSSIPQLRIFWLVEFQGLKTEP